MANYFALRPIVEAEFARRSREDWEARLIAEDVPFAPVLTMKDVAHHPQTEWLAMLEPEHGGKTLVRGPWRFNGKRPERPFEAPEVGQHSIEVAREVCSEDQVADLIAHGVILQHGQKG
jgi:formyl-CoA transferase